MAGLICPICGTATSFSPVESIGPGRLTPRRVANQDHYTEVSFPMQMLQSNQGKYYAIIKCQACGGGFIAERIGGEWSEVYPIRQKPVAEEIPPPIRRHSEEALLCFAVGAYVACLLMARTAAEGMWREQEVSNLSELKDKGVITNTLFEQANQVRRWANVETHREFTEPVTREEAELLLAYLKAVLNEVYVQPVRLSDMVNRLKEREQ